MDSVLSEDHAYMTPRRAVTCVSDMAIWEKSEAYFEYCGFIQTMNECVQAKTLSVDCPISDITQGMMALLAKLDVWIEETPPIEQPQRFGNKAFREWLVKVQEQSLDLLQEALPEKYYRAVPEIMVYLNESFGNATRIDYGTGHELAFLMFLCCLFKIGAFVEQDKVAVVTRVFNSYLMLARKLQLRYRMEPAGSHGVWSLDDYQFVPFIWGSSQLMGHPRIEPRSFLQQDVIEQYSKDYMFIGCIQFINQVKTGMFAEHSNQLWNISAVPTWSKVNGGLIKMYKNEILNKYPVIQHVLFGSILTFKLGTRPLPTRNIRLTSSTPQLSGTPPRNSCLVSLSDSRGVQPVVSSPAQPTISSPAPPTLSTPAPPTISSPAPSTISSPALPTVSSKGPPQDPPTTMEPEAVEQSE